MVCDDIMDDLAKLFSGLSLEDSSMEIEDTDADLDNDGTQSADDDEDLDPSPMVCDDVIDNLSKLFSDMSLEETAMDIEEDEMQQQDQEIKASLDIDNAFHEYITALENGNYDVAPSPLLSPEQLDYAHDFIFGSCQ